MKFAKPGKEMEKEQAKSSTPHVVIVPYPAQGHINPMLQFGNILASKGVRATLATTIFSSKSMPIESCGSVHIETISDGFDEAGYAGAKNIQAYISSLQIFGSLSLDQLIARYSTTVHPVDCVVYDSAITCVELWSLIWASLLNGGMLSLPISSNMVSIPGLPLLGIDDLPSFISKPEEYPAYLDSLTKQYSNVEKADFVLVNTVFELEENVVNAISTIHPMLTIGPVIPSIFSNKLGDDRKDSNKNRQADIRFQDHEATWNWLNTKPRDSVVYVAFGSQATLTKEQYMELAWALKASNHYHLWVIRAPEQAKLPNHLFTDTGDKGIIIKWSRQMEVLENESVGCFLTHCGWNSTLEALCSGVPKMAMPQWADQQTNAKLIQDVWSVGKRVKLDKNGIVSGRELLSCIREVMDGEEMKVNATSLSTMIKRAVSREGSSDKNIDVFVSRVASRNY
ncbi:UDP-glycosyltransferase 74F2-like protein [Drosera capensis]